MRKSVLIAIGLILVVAGWYLFMPPTPRSVLAQIERNGAKAYVLGHFETDEWNSVMHGIGTGDVQWLRVAQTMAPGTDADSAEQLAESLAHALVANPQGTLEVLDRQKGSFLLNAAACFADSDSIDPAVRESFVSRARAALSRVDDPALQKVKAECLHQLSKRLWTDP